MYSFVQMLNYAALTPETTERPEKLPQVKQ